MGSCGGSGPDGGAGAPTLVDGRRALGIRESLADAGDGGQIRSALGGAHEFGFNSGCSSSRAHPATQARTPAPIPTCNALLKCLVKWLEMSMLRIDPACVCDNLIRIFSEQASKCTCTG